MAGESPLKPNEVKAPPPKVFECPSCGAGVVIRAVGQSVSVVCQACGSIIDASNENYKIISTFIKKMKVEPVIPLGQRGQMRGLMWEVIGFMQRCDGSGTYSWEEYLLFNPLRGFRWLTEFDGHWNYVTMIKEKPILTTKTAINGTDRAVASYLGKVFYLFNKGTAKVKFVIGEFYWQVKADEKVDVQDYISPPQMLSCERTKDEVVWSVGEYIPSDEIKSAFQILKPMPLQIGVAPNQPSTLSDLAPDILKYWGIFVGILIAIQIFSAVSSQSDQSYSGEFFYKPSDTEKVKVSPPFELRHGPANIQFSLLAPVQNTWLETNVDLINDQTGASYEFEQGVEYYSGYDSDGSWSEGNRRHNLVLSSIPDGTYHFNVEASGPGVGSYGQADPYHPPGMSYSIIVTRDVVTWSNFFWALFLLSIFPAIVWLKRRDFEHSRWSTSDFSPLWTIQDED